MDRSVDSIGSCSLDVDADSTDFSDTSGSLNLPTPLSGKDITREFTSRIKERCQITQINCHQQTTAVLDPTSGKISTIISCVESPISSPVKKPSYLNLACCVNGYSNLTTYDSKLRQNINKSREVSPIRPSSNSNLQTNRLSGNFLALPLTSNQKSPSSDVTMENRSIIQENSIFSHDHNVDTTDNIANDKYFQSAKFINSSNMKNDIQLNETKTSSKSFIQQRVERLYGPGALAQGFYSPKKTKSQEISILSERSSNSQIKYSTKTITLDHEITTTLNGKSATTASIERIALTGENCENFKNGCDLPVLRHLRPEFRAQLPIMSPKRSPNKFPVNESSSCPVLSNGTTPYMNGNDKHSSSTTIEHIVAVEQGKGSNTVNGTANNIINSKEISIIDNEIVTKKSIDDKKVLEKVKKSECDKDLSQQSLSVSSNPMTNKVADSNNIVVGGNDPLLTADEKENCKILDGNYFLVILKTEQDRLLVLADQTEKELEMLSDSEVSDEVFGYLRSASGKARLLATQKMKQFEGLCKNNLNQLPDDKFPTTNEDLQGFWDMVMLQVAHVDSLFKEIENLKANNWQNPVQDVPNAPPQGSKLTRRPNPSKPSATTNNTMANGASSKKSSASLLAAAQRREAQRKQLMEIKRKNKLAISSSEQQQPNKNQVVEIFVSEPCSS